MSALDGSISVGGAQVQKKHIAVAGAAAAGVVGYAWWKRRASAPAGDESPDYYADLRTGSDVPSDAYVNPGGGGASSPAGDDDPAPNSDPEWARRAVEMLTWYEPGHVSAVLGKYLARQPLTTEEAQLVREVWAQLGPPPSGQIAIIPAGSNATPVPTNPVPAKYVNIAKGFDWNRFIEWLRRKNYDPGHTMTMAKLDALNPGWIAQNVKDGKVIRAGRVRIA